MTVHHWMLLVPFFFEIFALAALLLILNFWSDFFTELSPELRFAINTTAIALLIHLFCFRMYNYFLKVMLITNYRLIDIEHSVFLRREREVISMSNIQDFRYCQNGLLPRIFKYGDLIVLGSSSDVKYTFHYVPKVNKVHHLMGEIHQRSIRHRNVFLDENRMTQKVSSENRSDLHIPSPVEPRSMG